MKTKDVTIFICEHCEKKMFAKGAMTKHEKWCNYNPANHRVCHDCKFLEETIIEYSVDVCEDEYQGSIKRKTTAFKCTHPEINKMVYPFKAEKKLLPIRFPETFDGQIPMKSECEHFESDKQFYYENNW